MGERSRQIFHTLFGVFCTGIINGVFFTTFAFAQSDFQPDTPGSKYVTLSLIVDRDVIQPRDSDAVPVAKIGAHLQIASGWHIYWENSGDSGMPTTLRWSIPAGWRTSDLRWPAPEKFLEKGGLTTYGYAGETVLISDLFSPAVIPNAGEHIDIAVSVNFLVCSDICIPGSATSSVSLPFSTSAPETPSKNLSLLAKFDQATPQPLIMDSPLLAGTKLTPLVSHTRLAPGTDAFFGTLITTNEPDLANRIQFFPRKSVGLKISVAQLRTSSAAESGSHSLLIASPLRILGESTAETTRQISGVLVLDNNKAGPLAFNLEGEITAANQSSESPKWHSLATGATDPRPLLYRSHSVAERKTSEVLVNESKVTPEPILSWAIGIALLSAFIAGMLLNLMPCVLPIISIKVLCVLREAHCSQKQRTIAALVYAAGILATFFGLALAVILLKQIGYQVGWGFQFQQPQFVFGLFLIVFLLSLSLFEVFILYVPGMQQVNRVVTGLKPSLLTNFFDGILATLLSTPCTAPFLGTALVFAFTQGPLVTVLVFQAIGLGLALPYVYLVTHPSLMFKLPKPGPWMNRFKQVMGFLLLGTALWLLFILHRLSGEGAIWAIVASFVIFFALWVNLWLRESTSLSGRKRVLRTLLNVATLFAILRLWPLATANHLSPTTEVTRSSRIKWLPYSDVAIANARQEKRPVFIDFTAEWCVTCKFNEQFAIETDTVSQALRESKAVALKADWTDGNQEITAALNRYGAQGVPLYVVIPPEGDPQTLTTIVTASQIASAIRAAS